MWVRVKSAQNARAAEVRNKATCCQLLRFAGHLSLHHKLGDPDWCEQDNKEEKGPKRPGQVWGCKKKAVFVPSLMKGKLGVATQRKHTFSETVQFSSVAQSCLTLCDPMNPSTPGLHVHHQLPESTQTHVH